MDATDEEIYRAAELSYASEFIEKLKDKFETKIGEDGIRLSGGEKQRLSIARAILKKAELYFLMKQLFIRRRNREQNSKSYSLSY